MLLEQLKEASKDIILATEAIELALSLKRGEKHTNQHGVEFTTDELIKEAKTVILARAGFIKIHIR